MGITIMKTTKEPKPKKQVKTATRAKAKPKPKEDAPPPLASTYTSSPKLSPFDFLNNINAGQTSVNLMETCQAENTEGQVVDSADRQYNSFMINRGLSYFNDTVMAANELNKYGGTLPTKMQYDFLRHFVRPRKRFSKWFKRADDSSDVQLIAKHYNYNSTQARAALELYTPDELLKLRNVYLTGGKGGSSS
jgi:hypothetical protein